jgi:hypothetical protein
MGKFDHQKSPVRQPTGLYPGSPAPSSMSSPSSSSSGSEAGSPAHWPSPRSDKEETPLSPKSQDKDPNPESLHCDQKLQSGQQKVLNNIATQSVEKDGSDQIQVSKNEPPSSPESSCHNLQKPSQVQVSIICKRKWEEVRLSQDDSNAPAFAAKIPDTGSSSSQASDSIPRDVAIKSRSSSPWRLKAQHLPKEDERKRHRFINRKSREIYSTTSSRLLAQAHESNTATSTRPSKRFKVSSNPDIP